MQNARSIFRAFGKAFGHFGIALLVLVLLTQRSVHAADPLATDTSHAPPNAPANLSVAANGATAVILHWADNSEDEDGFRLERSPDGVNNWVQVDTIAPNVTSYDNGGLTCNTAYFYRVGASNGDGDSSFSNVATATTGACAGTVAGGQKVFMPTVSKPALISQAARLVDVTFSVYNAPTGITRSYYEGMIRYFADGVYEMTNGAHKLRRVTLYTNGQNADRANILWRGAGQCWPNATISGYTTAGSRIEMCDSNSSNEPYITANDADQQNAGYTTAHEWGHFYYGISDQYKGDPNSQNFGSLGPLPNDVAVQNSVMNQQRNAILGTTSQGQTFNGDFNWLNFDTRLNNQGNNSQFRLYGASGWDTLVRPSSADPRDEAREGYNVRDAYPELASFAPPPGQNPPIELPAGRASARSDLQIVWIDQPAGAGIKAVNSGGDGVVRQILIERSASMSNNFKLSQVQAAVMEIVDGAEIGDVIGIIQFDGTVSTTYPLTVIANQTTKDAMIAAIDAITLGNAQTALGDALQSALDGFTSAGILSNTVRTVYLIADSASTTGRDPFGVVQSYANSFVTLHTFGVGTGGNTADALQRLAQQAGGDYYFVSDSTGLLDALGEAGEVSSPVVDADIAQGVTTIPAATTLSRPFHVDPSVNDLEVDVVYTGGLLSATVTLLDPTGTPTSDGDCGAFDVDTGEETYCAFVINTPAAGNWTLQVVATDTIDLAYAALATSSPNTNTFIAVAESVYSEGDSDVLISPAKLVVRAQAQKDWPITSVTISGTVELPNGTEQGFALRDDGVAPDTLAQDGIYMAELNSSAEGDYYITVRFNNHNTLAKYTQYSINLDGGPDGVQPAYRAPWPVGVDFERVATLQVSVVK